MFYIYLAIALFILIITILDMFEDDNIFSQMNAALIIIPLILRLLMIK
ncbi:MAG: hypothetical protein Q7K48_07805 [Fusobacterium sp. JB021]|nr:hypothetical protein [Fusobacterium sp. JB021]